MKGIGDHSSKNTDILEDFKLGIAISTAQALALAQVSFYFLFLSLFVSNYSPIYLTTLALYTFVCLSG